PTEVIGAGDGVIVPCGDPNSIAEAMLAIAEGAESSAAIEARKHRCAERFSEYVVCQALNDIYRRVIGQHRYQIEEAV
ncbi:hypothetical protein, partial [Vibrio vulnificus]|uniref:hypothetical protein n=1 Tax=Vibrio vulnificus TaxID=672 RepID=UPI0039B38EFD